MALDPISTILAAALLAPVPPSATRFWEERQRTGRQTPSDTDKPLVAAPPATSQLFGSDSPMFVDLRQQLDDALHVYAGLSDGWDGPRSVAPSAAGLDAAHMFIDALPGGIPLPTAMVTATGEVGFYWDLDGGYADMSFDRDGFGSLFVRNARGEEVFLEDLNVRHLSRKWFFDHLGEITGPMKAAA